MYQDTLTTKFIKPVTVTMKLLVEKVLTTTDYQKESISIKRTDLCASVESALVSGRRLLQRSLRQPFQGSNGILRDYLNKKTFFRRTTTMTGYPPWRYRLRSFVDYIITFRVLIVDFQDNHGRPNSPSLHCSQHTKKERLVVRGTPLHEPCQARYFPTT